MTKTYIGCDLYRLQFESNVDVQLAESEIKEIVEEFIELSDKASECEDAYYKLRDNKDEEIKELTNKVEELEKELEKCNTEDQD